MNAAQTVARPPVLVMGVGNLLRGDDGFGNAVLEELMRRGLPSSVELLDAGTSVIDLMDEFDGRDKLVVIDAVRGGQAPGTLFRFCPEEVAAEAVPADSLHQVGLLETLRLAELVDCRPPQTVIIGVQPQATALGIGLSPEVADSVEKAADLVMKELGPLQ